MIEKEIPLSLLEYWRAKITSIHAKLLKTISIHGVVVMKKSKECVHFLFVWQIVGTQMPIFEVGFESIFYSNYACSTRLGRIWNFIFLCK